MIKMIHLVLLEDFNTQAKKYIDSGIDKAIVKSYIEKFKKIRDAKPNIAKTADIHGLKVPAGNSRFDIDKYEDFHELESFVDYVVGQVANISTQGTHFDKIEVDGKPLVAKNGLEIYYAKDKHACIKYKGDKPYTWCISRTDSSNMYNTYRYKDHSPTFYFIKDIAATKEEFSKPFTGTFSNPYHFFVVQATSYEDTFIVTSANNDGDNQVSWEKLVEIIPKLDGLREYFVNVPLEPKELDRYNLFKKGVSDEEFKKLSYEDKENYLDVAIPAVELTDVQFALLPHELKNKFISFGIGLSNASYNLIKHDKTLFKRYYQISLRKYKEHIANPYSGMSLNDSEYDAILSQHEGRELIKSSGEKEIIEVMKSVNSVKKLIDSFGQEIIVNLINQFPVPFVSYSNPEEYDFVFSLLSQPILDKLTIRDIYSHFDGLTVRFTNSGLIPLQYIYSLINVYLKYKKVLTKDDAITLIPCNSETTAELSDYMIDLYSKKLAVGFEDSYYYFYETTGDFIKTLKIFGGQPSLDAISGSDLTRLFIKYFYGEYKKTRKDKTNLSPEDKSFILSAISTSLRKKINGYDIVVLLKKYNHVITPEIIQQLIDYCGGAEFIKTQLKSTNIAELLRITSPENLDKIKEISSQKEIDKIDEYHIKQFLFRDKVPIEKMAAIVGPVAIGNISDYGIYGIIKDKPKFNESQENIERLINVFIAYKGSKLSFNTSNSNLATFLIYSHDIDKLVTAFGADKFKLMDSYDIWHVITECANEAPEKCAKILALIGKESLYRMVNYISREQNIIFQLSRGYRGNMAMLDAILPYINDTLPPHIISWFLSRITGNAFNKYIALVGTNNIRKLDKDEVKNVLKSWNDVDIRAKALIPIFGKEYIRDIYKEDGLPLSAELLQEEYRMFKEYFKY